MALLNNFILSPVVAFYLVKIFFPAVDFKKIRPTNENGTGLLRNTWIGTNPENPNEYLVGIYDGWRDDTRACHEIWNWMNGLIQTATKESQKSTEVKPTSI